jgi:hypothetical protein
MHFRGAFSISQTKMFSTNKHLSWFALCPALRTMHSFFSKFIFLMLLSGSCFVVKSYPLNPYCNKQLRVNYVRKTLFLPDCIQLVIFSKHTTCRFLCYSFLLEVILIASLSIDHWITPSQTVFLQKWSSAIWPLNLTLPEQSCLRA